MKRTAGFAVALAGLMAQAALAQDEQSVVGIMAKVKQQIASQCAQSRSRMTTASGSYETEQASATAKMSCECMPKEVDRAEADLSGGRQDATTSREAFVARMRVALTTCAADLVRAQTPGQCEAESKSALGVGDKKAYCACVSERLNALDNETIAMAASAAHRNMQNRVKARAAGLPDPQAAPTAIDGIKESCKQGLK